MKTQWADKNGVVHVIPVNLADGATWCNVIIAIEEEELLDLAPTCIACIASAAHYYALPNIRQLHVR